MSFHKQVEGLKKVNQTGSNKVFTMYLNTDPSDPEQQGGKWKIQFKNGLRNFETYLKEGDNKEELENFKKVKEKVENYVFENEQNLLRGIIVFATADDEVWFAERVQLRLKSEFYWEETPVLDQLENLKEKYPKTGLILVQQNQIKILETYLNELEQRHFYELDIDTEDWSEKLGPRKGGRGMGPGAANLQKENFNARFEANQQRWYKRIAPVLDKLAKDGNWEKTYIVGERDAAQELEKQMNRSVDEVVFKNMLEHEESKVINELSHA